jgi:uncharacterized protein YbbK (DUF523 family)
MLSEITPLDCTSHIVKAEHPGCGSSSTSPQWDCTSHIVKAEHPGCGSSSTSPQWDCTSHITAQVTWLLVRQRCQRT